MSDPEKLKGKLSSDDEKTLEKALPNGQSFLDENSEVEKEEFDEKKRKEIEGICEPMIQKSMVQGGVQGEEDEENWDYDL